MLTKKTRAICSNYSKTQNNNENTSKCIRYYIITLIKLQTKLH